MIDRMLYFSDGTVLFVFADAFLRPAAGREAERRRSARWPTAPVMRQPRAPSVRSAGLLSYPKPDSPIYYDRSGMV